MGALHAAAACASTFLRRFCAQLGALSNSKWYACMRWRTIIIFVVMYLACRLILAAAFLSSKSIIALQRMDAEIAQVEFKALTLRYSRSAQDPVRAIEAKAREIQWFLLTFEKERNLAHADIVDLASRTIFIVYSQSNEDERSVSASWAKHLPPDKVWIVNGTYVRRSAQSKWLNWSSTSTILKTVLQRVPLADNYVFLDSVRYFGRFLTNAVSKPLFYRKTFSWLWLSCSKHIRPRCQFT